MRFEPSGVDLEVERGSSLFAAARRAGLPVGTACEAEGVCGRCGLRPLSGAEHLSQETPQEQRVKADNNVDAGLRLSCVVRVLGGPVVITADHW